MRRLALLPPVLLLATSLAVLLVFLIVRQNVAQIETLRDDSLRVSHTLEVQQQLDAVLLTVTDAERMQTAYLLTEIEDYLGAYRETVRQLEAEIGRLAGQVGDNAGQAARIERLRFAKDRKLALLDEGIETLRTRGRDAAASVMSDVDRPILTEMRAISADMATAEAGLLSERRARAEQAYQAAVAGRIGSGIVTSLLLVSLAVFASARARARERTTQLIAQEREHLSVTLASIGDAVIATDVNGRVTLMNPIAAAITGWRPEDAIGLPIQEVFRIVNEATRQSAENPVSRVLAEGKIVDLGTHAILIARDGRERPIDNSGAPIRSSDGRIRGAVLVFRDVSERRAQEQALLQSEQRFRDAAHREELARKEAETANRLKDEFLAVLSHELRTPLNAVVGWAQILQGVAPQDGTLARGLASIKRNADAQHRLVEDLLDVSRIVSGKLSMDRRPIDLRSPIAAALEAIRPTASAKDVLLTTELDGPSIVNADADRIQQVASNLLSNAVKFTPKGGRVDVSLRADNGTVSFTVRDTGQGLSASLLPFIFDRFRQGDASTTRTHGGLGLGLAIAKYIVEAHGGTIEASSDGEGKGAAFSIRLAAEPHAGDPVADIIAEEDS
jgi:PAS domain S-box-containing protein